MPLSVELIKLSRQVSCISFCGCVARRGELSLKGQQVIHVQIAFRSIGHLKIENTIDVIDENEWLMR